jgi:hypothetical protein
MREISFYDRNLTILELHVLHDRLDEHKLQFVADKNKISVATTRRIIKGIKILWQVKNDVGLVKMAITKGYYDLGVRMDGANLHYWSSRVHLSEELSIAIKNYLTDKDIYSFSIGSIQCIDFIALDCSSPKLWTELENKRLEYSNMISKANKLFVS